MMMNAGRSTKWAIAHTGELIVMSHPHQQGGHSSDLHQMTTMDFHTMLIVMKIHHHHLTQIAKAASLLMRTWHHNKFPCASKSFVLTN